MQAISSGSRFAHPRFGYRAGLMAQDMRWPLRDPKNSPTFVTRTPNMPAPVYKYAAAEGWETFGRPSAGSGDPRTTCVVPFQHQLWNKRLPKLLVEFRVAGVDFIGPSAIDAAVEK